MQNLKPSLKLVVAFGHTFLGSFKRTHKSFKRKYVLLISSCILLASVVSGQTSFATIEQQHATALEIGEVYPSPVQSEICITVFNHLSKPTEVQIYNLTGKLVHQETMQLDVHSVDMKIDVNHFKEGIYFLIFPGEGPKTITRKFIKIKSF